MKVVPGVALSKKSPYQSHFVAGANSVFLYLCQEFLQSAE